MLSPEPNAAIAEPEDVDQKVVFRRMTLFRVSVITIAGRRELCLIRNISKGGLRAFVYSAVPVGQHITIELNPGEATDAVVIWQKDSLIGVQFDHEIDLADFLGGKFNSRNGQRPRMPRVELDRLGELRIGARRYPINSCDIGQGGARIEIDQPIKTGEAAVVMLEKFPPIAGTIRWYRQGKAGIAFDRVMPFKELLHLMRS